MSAKTPPRMLLKRTLAKWWAVVTRSAAALEAVGGGDVAEQALAAAVDFGGELGGHILASCKFLVEGGDLDVVAVHIGDEVPGGGLARLQFERCRDEEGATAALECRFGVDGLACAERRELVLR